MQGNIRISQSSCKKVFIPRDYSIGCGVKFQEKLPQELEGKIDKDKFEAMVRHLNTLYAEAEQASCSTYSEGCMACMTAYVIFFCSETHYEKCLKKVSRYVHEQNEKVHEEQSLQSLQANALFFLKKGKSSFRNKNV